MLPRVVLLLGALFALVRSDLLRQVEGMLHALTSFLL